MECSFYRLKSVILLLSFSAIILGGCREHVLISSKVSPASDTVGVHADTLYCITHSYFDNDLITSSNFSGYTIYEAAGNLTDPYFGTTTAATFFNIDNTNSLSYFDLSKVVDSVFLQLPYADFTFGDTTDHTLTQTYQVFYMNDSIGYTTQYGPSSDKPVDIGNPLSDPTTVNISHLKDSVVIHGTNYSPSLRIKLNKANAMSRLNYALAKGSASTTPSAAFIAAFNGICVRGADSRKFGKALPYFKLNGGDDFSKAGLLVYYHDTARTDSALIMPFLFDQNTCGHFNNISRSYSRFPVNNLYHSTQVNDDIVGLQNQPGASIDIKIGGLMTAIPKGVVINKAEIQISLIGSLNPSTLQAPVQIFPVGIGNGLFPSATDAGAEYTVEDRKPLTSLSAYNIFDGTSHSLSYDTTNITTFTIGIPREVIASIAANNDTLHYHIRGTQLLYGAYRMLAAGGNYPDKRYKAKLIVVHSSLKN